MDFILNGETHLYEGDLDCSLLDYLRNEKGIITVKDGCSGQGACGACTVQMDGKAILSCVTPMKKVIGKSVITTDGIGQRIQEVFARAFAVKGGVQCGFCTPGIVISAKVLLENNSSPTREEVIMVINKHLCRCTGYKKIVDSIMYAASILRGECGLPDKNHSGKVGTSIPKYDIEETVLGLRPFVCDITEVGMKFGALKFSDHPRAKVLSIDTLEAEQMEGVLRVFTAEDVPGERMTGLIVKDWPFMVSVGEETRYIGDVLASVVAETEKIARAAVKKIKVEYEVKTPLCTVDDSMRSDYQIHQRGNILSHTKIKRGDMQEAENKTKWISKGTYYTQRIEHAFIEPECAFAIPMKIDDQNGIKIYSQGQGPYEDRKQIAAITGHPQELIRVIQVPNGGGFGGKEDLTVQGHAALTAYLCDVPVRLKLTREESLCMHPKRHPLRMKYSLGCDQNGMLTFLKATIHGDTGAYASVGMKVLERAAGHAAGAYEVPVVDISSTAVYTNNIPCGAMRGFGVNQTAFAMEGSVDELCEQGEFDRWQFRYDNALDEGRAVSTGQILKGPVGLRQTLLAVKEEFYQADYAGLACGIKNTGIGNGMADTTQAKIEIKSTERIIIHHGWAEMGQGVNTMALQSFCQETGISPNLVEVRADTSEETVCGMTTSSRGTSLVGNAVIDACKKLNEDLKNNTLEELSGREYRGEWICDWTTDPADESANNIEQVTHYSYSFATQLAVLDKRGKLKKVYAAHDAGKIMNPTLFEGQIEGSVHMGIGYALTENFPMSGGRPVHQKLGKCGIIRPKYVTEVIVKGIEAPDPHGPFGARGVGEIGLVPTAGAVANAIYQFDKIRRYSLPIGVKRVKKK